MRSASSLAMASLIVSVAAAPAQAEAWVVASSGVIGCQEIEAIKSLADRGALKAAALTVSVRGCAVLDSGERVIYEPEVGTGFADYMRVQRRNGAVLYVKSAALARDPACGTLGDDRAGY